MEQQSHNWVIIIDPFTKEILRTKIETSLDNIKKILDCDYIESVTLYNYPQTFVLCDENGRVNRKEKEEYTKIGSNVYVNKVMLIGAEQAEFADCLLKLEDVNHIIKFMPNDYDDNELDEFIYLTGKHRT
tara:strand:+ start:14982 stop:15371 length:390 start_codon:yes stop_codon:yes gene_type:complete